MRYIYLPIIIFLVCLLGSAALAQIVPPNPPIPSSPPIPSNGTALDALIGVAASSSSTGNEIIRWTATGADTSWSCVPTYTPPGIRLANMPTFSCNIVCTQLGTTNSQTFSFDSKDAADCDSLGRINSKNEWKNLQNALCPPVAMANGKTCGITSNTISVVKGSAQ